MTDDSSVCILCEDTISIILLILLYCYTRTQLGILAHLISISNIKLGPVSALKSFWNRLRNEVNWAKSDRVKAIFMEEVNIP